MGRKLPLASIVRNGRYDPKSAFHASIEIDRRTAASGQSPGFSELNK
jgi:hypothetical protein